MSRGVCEGRRLPLNWAMIQSGSYRHLTTRRRMAPENGSQSCPLASIALLSRVRMRAKPGC
jgi:hypothetical protein